MLLTAAVLIGMLIWLPLFAGVIFCSGVVFIELFEPDAGHPSRRR